MNLAFLIGFMTFHFYLNLAFHANVSTIRILIVIVAVVVLIAGGNSMERSNPARASTRQGAHCSLSDVSLMQH